MSDQELNPVETTTEHGLTIWTTRPKVRDVYLQQFGEDKLGIFYIGFEHGEGHWGYTHVLAEPDGEIVSRVVEGVEQEVNPPEPIPGKALATVLVDYDAAGNLMGIEIVDLPRTAQDWEREFKDEEIRVKHRIKEPPSE